jgi:hypothetical protein
VLLVRGGNNIPVNIEFIKRLVDEWIEDGSRFAWWLAREFAKGWRIDIGDEAVDGSVDHVGRRGRAKTPKRDGIGQPSCRIFTGPVRHGSILPRSRTTGI